MFKHVTSRLLGKASRRFGPAYKSVILVNFCAAMSLTLSAYSEDAVEMIEIRTPIAWQVIQREGYKPSHAHYNTEDRSAFGSANIQLGGTCSLMKPAKWQYRLATHAGVPRQESWQDISVKQQANEWSGAVHVPAGGWYKLEIRAQQNEATIGQGVVSPIGVGEVFVVAGQSYAAGANDELISVDDVEKRVVAYDAHTGKWQIANDPQPNVGDGGTIWPPLGDLLVPLLDVPVGFVNVSFGGTASRQWLPGEPLYANMVDVGRSIGRFRAVLWQQGESDVIEKVNAVTYVRNLSKIRRGLEKEWEFAPPWLVAKSTYHPMVYNDPIHEGTIRGAYDELYKKHGFLPGPDTDVLGGIHRGGPGSRQHFSSIGQRRAALVWFASIWSLLSDEDDS